LIGAAFPQFAFSQGLSSAFVFCRCAGPLTWRDVESSGELVIETEIPEGLIAWRGAKLSLETSFEWEFKGWRQMGLKFMDVFEGKVGLGFKMVQIIEFEPNLSKGWCWDIIGKKVSVLGYEFGASLQACFDISFSKIKIRLPRELEYY
jgi:hypothetical protein